MAQPDTSTKSQRGASAATVDWKAMFAAWRSHHRESALDSWQRLLRSPLQNLLSALVIGITLALPTLFGITLDNLHTLGKQWDGAPRLSVFLKIDASPEAIETARKTLATTAGVSDITLVTPAQGLAEFEKQSGISDTLILLDKNPLPAVLIATFLPLKDVNTLEQIQTQWQSIPDVDFVQADLAWVKKMTHLLEIGHRIAVGLAIMLGLGALLSIGNTIRLSIESRRAEIVVASLVGATDAFIRRPFLYTGFWYGLAGGLVAVVLVFTGYQALVKPVAELTHLYQSDFVLRGLYVSEAIGLFLIGVLLGILGSWLAVSQHLHTMRPR